MTVNQISVFLENRYGSLNRVLGLLAGSDIRILATTVADTFEFGIMRLIVDEPQRAYAVLKENNVNVHLTDVFAIALACNAAEGFRDAIAHFTHAGLSIEYMYSFSCGGRLVLVLRTNDPEATREVIRRQEIPCLAENELATL